MEKQDTAKSIVEGAKEALSLSRKGDFTFSFKPYSLSGTKRQGWIESLPGHCIINKQLLLFFVNYRVHLGQVVLLKYSNARIQGTP